MLYKLVLYGAGKRCKKLCKFLKDSSYEITAILDSNPQKWGDYVEDFLVESPERLIQLDNVSICITVADRKKIEQIRKNLQQIYCNNLCSEISYSSLIFEVYKSNPIIMQKILGQKEIQNKGKSVLFDCYDGGLGLGGIEAWTIDICSALLQSREKNTYIISRKGVYDVPILANNQIIYADRKCQDRFAIENIMCLIEVIMEKLPCTIVTAHVDAVMWAAHLIRCFYPDKIKVISVIHEGYDKAYDRYVDFSECTDIYIGVSQDIKNAMIERGIAPDTVFSMTCPFECKEVLKRSYSEDNRKPVCIGYSGRLDGLKHSVKRMDLILELIDELAKEKVHFRLELAGDGPARKEMEDFVFSRKLNDRVCFLGRLERSELSDFWQRQDICINVSDCEGRCISKLEAMANGAVPIITETAGAREDIVDGENGYIVPVGDCLTVAKKIKYLAEHREKICQMGRLAHDTVYPKSGMEQHLKFWEEILYKEQGL